MEEFNTTQINSWTFSRNQSTQRTYNQLDNLRVCFTPEVPKRWENSKHDPIIAQKLFQRVQNQQRKNNEFKIIRNNRNNFYEKLYRTLTDQLKVMKNHSTNEAKQQMKLIEKCRNYKHTRKSLPIRQIGYKNILKQSKPIINNSKFAYKFKTKIENLMRQCQKQNNDVSGVKNNMKIFTYFCNRIDKNLQSKYILQSKDFNEFL